MMYETLSQPQSWPQCFTGIDITTLQRMSHAGAAGSVNQWLKEVRLTTETECVCVLQGKSLSAQSTDIHLPPSRTLKDYADVIKRRAAGISSDFAKLFRHVENERWTQVHDGGVQLTCQIRSLLHECDTALHKPSARFIKQQQIVMEESARLAQYVDSFTDAKAPDGAKETVLHLLSGLGQSFSVLVDVTLSIIVWNLLASVDERQPVHQVKDCLTQLLTLALQGDNMCLLITRVVGAGERACYVWRVDVTDHVPESMTCTFTVQCCPEGLDLTALPCTYTFSLDHIQTLYTVETSVVPPPGMNLCSAGSLCDLLVDIQQLTATTPATGLYYQVQSDHYWAVCDSTAAGMCKLETNQFRTHVCIRPLLGGYLPLPSVELCHKRTAETPGGTGVDTQSDVTFSVSQVYNRSAATQVHVLPAATGSLQVTTAM